MLIIENIDTLIQGINKIKENINIIKKLMGNLSLLEEEKILLNNNIIYFQKNIKGLENLLNLYNSFDDIEQQGIIDLTLDLYNDTNKVIQILS